MAEEHIGQRKEASATPWTKLFSGFKVALDPKKLLLAGGGILMMWLGWFVLAWLFFDLFSANPPQFVDYRKGAANPAEAWSTFRSDRQKWNLRNEMAGSRAVAVDAGDIANTLAEFEAVDAIERSINLSSQKASVSVDAEKLTGTLTVDSRPHTFSTTKEAAEKLKDVKSVAVAAVRVAGREKDGVAAMLNDVRVTMDALDLEKSLEGAKTLEQLRREYVGDAEKLRALAMFEQKLAPKVMKPAGKLRTLPWSEERGPNPYLLVTGKARPWEAGNFLRWLAYEQIPVLLEPLYKFITPIVYLLDPAAGFWNRIYLLLVILWTLATWAVFGGAITRLAAVNVARPNEKVGLGEAFGFAWKRFQSYFSAPLFPLLFLAFFTVMLILFGLFEGLIPLVGDIFIAGFLWPIVLILGLVMAVVLVGLVGWPLMYATISAEGSDSFDALSRSYSYVYQAPWQYLWYSFLAVLYGAVLVFFVGFMASLTVYLGKWGVSQAPFLEHTNVEKDREPSYLFVYAPTSFGWRDLLLSSNRNHTVQTPNGGFDLSPAYREKLSWYNRIGAALVMVWLGLFFLLIVGFGYSYFWSASTIIYLLMRHKVDDTEIDEIHLEEEDQEPVMPPPSAPPPAAPPGGAGLTMVEAPTLRSPAASPPSDEPPATVSEGPSQPPS